MNRNGNMRIKSPLVQTQSTDATRETLNERHKRNRSLFSLALIPVALLGITCGFSVVQRAAAAITHSDKAENVFGHMSMDEAKQSASKLCTELTGSPATATDVSRQCAYSWRRHSMVREWNVMCDSSEGQYLVRINADSRRIYAINRMDNPATGKGASADSAEPLTEPILMTRTLAEERALKYLQIVGVPSQGLTQLEFTNPHYETSSSEEAIPQWNFTYRRSVPGLGKRLLKVSINGETGGLEHVWNPVFAL
jgi:hypothetical protein